MFLGCSVCSDAFTRKGKFIFHVEKFHWNEFHANILNEDYLPDVVDFVNVVPVDPLVDPLEAENQNNFMPRINFHGPENNALKTAIAEAISYVFFGI